MAVRQRHFLDDEGDCSARPLKRTIQQRIENPLAAKILAGEFGAGDTVVVDGEGKSMVFSAGSDRAPA